MGGRSYSCLLLMLAAVAVNYLDCNATPGRTHLPRRDAMDAACQRHLSDIEVCLFGYEQLLVSSRALDTTPGQLQQHVARRLCRLVRREGFRMSSVRNHGKLGRVRSH